MKKLLFFVPILFLFVSCSHNPSMITMGDKTNFGFDPANSLPNYSKINGLGIVDVPRENTYLNIEIDAVDGIQFDKGTNTIKGIKSITRKTGPQVTGYLVELAEANPDLAAIYLQYYMEMSKADTVKELLDKQLKLEQLKAENNKQKESEKEEPAGQPEQPVAEPITEEKKNE